ncbi:MAG: hydroxysqualene dehydroxylase HpnE [Planctomycetota bacterium]
MPHPTLILGGGLAGLAAAVALASHRQPVTLLESKPRLGGRASSFPDPATGELIDLCQHVAMGCCTNFAHFCKTLGLSHFLTPQPDLFFMTPDRRVTRFGGDRLPAPLHLARGFMRLHTLTLGEKLRVAYALQCLKRPTDDDPPFADWLAAHRQTPRIVERFWSVILTSALNETPDRIGLRYARKVFVDGFLTHPRGFEVELPNVPLGRLYGVELQSWLRDHGVEVIVSAPVRRIRIENGRAVGVELRSDEMLAAEQIVSALPFERLLDVLPPEVIDGTPAFANLRHLTHSPITSVHAWFDRSATELPHVVLVDCLGQWVFNRGEVAPGEHYLQVVVSAARLLRDLGRDETERRVIAELRDLFPTLKDATLRRAKVITDQLATFSAAPGVDRWRPPQQSPLANLYLAGDWTATGWPATMEGAVRSGYLAADALLKNLGRTVKCLQPDLGKMS